LTAKGLTTGEIAAHFADIYGATVSKDTISRITEKVIAEMTEWRNRPSEPVYPVVFTDAIFVKIRDGQVANRPIYVAVGVTCAGERESSDCGLATVARACNRLAARKCAAPPRR
jgi:putative transposase